MTIGSKRAINAAKMCIQRKRETLCMCRYPVMDVRCAPSKAASKAMVSQNYSTISGSRSLRPRQPCHRIHVKVLSRRG